MADAQMPCWSQILYITARRIAPLVPIADSATPNCLFYRLDEIVCVLCCIYTYMLALPLWVCIMNEL